MGLRIIFSIILCLSVVFAPFYLSFAIALIGLFYFKKYIEAPLLFFLSDLLYGAEVTRFKGTLFVSFFALTICLILVEMLKKKLKFYSI